MAEQNAPLRAYIGTYAPADEPGIYCGLFHWDTARLELTGSIRGVQNPSYLAAAPGGRVLYAASEIDVFGGEPAGGVYAYALDGRTGQPSLLNSQASGGASPCYLCVDSAGRFVLAANYSGGTVALLPIREDGSLAETAAVAVHHGSGINPQRQTRPHAHSVVMDTASRFALAADLGTDRLLVYLPDPNAGTLAAHDPPGAAAPPGSGPRHSVFHPSGRFLYTITELASTIVVWEYDSALGTVREVEHVSTLPDDFSGKSAASGIKVHPSGKFLYGANRGPDTIAVFAIDAETGRLTRRGIVPSGGQNPRDLALDPDGAFLFAVNQDSGTVVSFHIDPQTGGLAPTGEVTEVPAAACLVLLV